MFIEVVHDRLILFPHIFVYVYVYIWLWLWVYNKLTCLLVNYKRSLGSQTLAGNQKGKKLWMSKPRREDLKRNTRSNSKFSDNVMHFIYKDRFWFVHIHFVSIGRLLFSHSSQWITFLTGLCIPFILVCYIVLFDKLFHFYHDITHTCYFPLYCQYFFWYN